MTATAIRFTLVTVLVLAAGCQRQLIKTPNVYLDAPRNPFAEVPPALRTASVDLLYFTDRKPEGENHAGVRYGYNRSLSSAWGSLVVQIGNDLSWDELVEASRTRQRKTSLPLRVTSIVEKGRFPEVPAPIEIERGEVVEQDSHVARERAALAAFHEELGRRLALTPRKEAFVFVHGYNNSLEDAAFRMAELWHFLGREGVPIVYSWPAGAPGLVRGYTRDRESGEFTIFHLKDFLQGLAACPELEKINLIAHSRGTDVCITAIRELILVSRAAGLDPQATLKLEDVVLAAPDIDHEVSTQRNAAENLTDGFARGTIYVTARDRALGTAEWLFSNPKRLGKTRPEQLSEADRKRMSVIPNVTVIDARVRTDYMGHGYFLADPATCSDLILLLRYDRPIGTEYGRPLVEVAPEYYVLDDDYPQKPAEIRD